MTPEEFEDAAIEASKLPPFKIRGVRVAIPHHCWVASSQGISTVGSSSGPSAVLPKAPCFGVIFVLGHDWSHVSFRKCVAQCGWPLASFLHSCGLPLMLSESAYRGMDQLKYALSIALPLFAYPAYLWMRSPGKEGFHFIPSSILFKSSERNDVIISSICWAAMVCLLLCLSWADLLVTVLKFYGSPWFS